MKLYLAALTGGIWCVQMLPALPSAPWRVLLLILAIVAVKSAKCRAFGWFVGGLLWVCWRADLALAARVPAAYTGKTLQISGQVSDLPRLMARGIRFEMVVDGMARDSARWSVHRPKILLSNYRQTPTLRAGAHCVLQVRLRAPRGLRGPGAFDAERWYFANGVRALGYVVEHPGNTCTVAPTFSLVQLRERLAAQIAARSPPSASPILAALTVGARQQMTEAQWRILRETGVVHLVSVSGLHVAMVAWAGYWLALLSSVVLSLLTRRVAPIPLCALFAFAAATTYALLAGFSVPTQRTLLMVGVALINRVRGQTVLSGSSLLLACALVMVCDPFAALTLSFWLSFGAVALLALMAVLRTSDGRWRALATQCWLSLLLLPLSALAWPHIALSAPIANLVAIPIVTLSVVPLCLLGILTAGIAGFNCYAGAAAVWDGLWQFLMVCAREFPSQPWPYGMTTTLMLLLTIAALGLWSPLRRARWLLTPALLGVACLAPVDTLRDGEFELTTLDVGQGLAVLVNTARHTLVYDTGPSFGDGFDMALAAVIPALRASARTRIDRLVVSHADNDHAGGARSLAQALPVTNVMSSGLRVLSALPAQRSERCVAGQTWQWDGVEFIVLWPRQRVSGSDNDHSCVIYIKGRSGSALLPGDISSRVEAKLLESAPNRADILVVPHHGSATSSSKEWVARLQPRIAVVSAGDANRFGHPAPSVLATYRQRGIPVWQTARHGSVSIVANSPSARPRAYRWEHRRYWDVPLRAPMR